MASAAAEKSEEKAVNALAGFEPVITGHQGWLKVVENRPIHGKIVGFEEKPDGTGFQYLIELLEPAPGQADGELFNYSVGDVVALNESNQLAKGLRHYVETKAEVYIVPGELKPLKKGTGKYREFDIQVKKGTKKGAIPDICRSAASDTPF